MNCSIRLVVEEDAQFILSLRMDPRLNKHLSHTSAGLEDQKNWIHHYKEREKLGNEFYFLISEGNEKRGLYRLYYINKISFTIGSWLFNSCIYKHLPILTDLCISELGFRHLNKEVLLFDVRKANKKVMQYHLLKMPLWYNEDELNNYYLIKKDNWEYAKTKILEYFGIGSHEYENYKTTTGYPYL